MNKKLLALAIAAAIGGPLNAYAANSVTLYGRVGVEYGSVDIDQVATLPSSTSNDYRQESVSDNAGVSRWGLWIVEDLGGGLKANARIEYSFFTGEDRAQLPGNIGVFSGVLGDHIECYFTHADLLALLFADELCDRNRRVAQVNFR